MEETLGKRIAAYRKGMGLTQDRLADLLGVTAQAVSKWENDQSCPDITTLPKLAEIFGVTTDALLGLTARPVPALTVREPEEDGSDGVHLGGNHFNLTWDAGRKGSIGLAVWVLLSGGLLLGSNLLDSGPSLWEILWTTALLVFGAFGLTSRFSAFHLGCALAGAYFLADSFSVLPFTVGRGLLLPIFLVLLGLGLLADALNKPRKGKFTLTHNGSKVASRQCTYDGETFDFSVSFGDLSQRIELPRLSGGKASVSFGEGTVDLTGCGEIAGGCEVELSCSFGELELLVPRTCRAELQTSTSFGEVEVEGAPDPDAKTICVPCSVSFGEVTVRYV